MTAIQEALNTTAVLDDVFYARNNGRAQVCWDIGTSNLHGMTPDGLSRAMTATAKWIDSLSEADKTALGRVAPRILIGTTAWSVPVVSGQEQAVRDLMLGVLRQAGSLGRMS